MVVVGRAFSGHGQTRQYRKKKKEEKKTKAKYRGMLPISNCFVSWSMVYHH